MQYIGHACVGDKIYGKRKQVLTQLGQMLSAVKLSFIHPSTKERMTFTCDVDEEFNRVLQEIKDKNL
jgi:23S rRNA pseudouridine1911/1915/1917 synthase